MEYQYSEEIQPELSIFERMVKACGKEFPSPEYDIRMQLCSSACEGMAVVTITCKKKR